VSDSGAGLMTDVCEAPDVRAAAGSQRFDGRYTLRFGHRGAPVECTASPPMGDRRRGRSRWIAASGRAVWAGRRHEVRGAVWLLLRDGRRRRGEGRAGRRAGGTEVPVWPGPGPGDGSARKQDLLPLHVAGDLHRVALVEADVLVSSLIVSSSCSSCSSR
jgi:hypothetical protein